MRLVAATKNPGKFSEIEPLLGVLDVELSSLLDFPDVPEIPEDGGTFLENALIKARAVAGFTGFSALADDSGLEVDALGGFPGVRSARFAPTTPERNAKLLGLLAETPDDQRMARFVCAIALVRPDGFEWSAIGVCEGLIARAPAGEGGFGYDPLFLYPPLGLTFAEIPAAEKNRISHRGQALAEFIKAVRENGILGDETGR